MKRVALCVLGFFMMTTVAFAGHPLDTDDAGTVGKSNVEVEFGVSFFSDKEEEDDFTKFKTEGGEMAAGVAVGLLENLDLVLAIPYLWFAVDENDHRVEKEDGLSDIEFEAKWRFFEKNGWGIALKPGITLPTGNEDRGLGADRFGYSMFLIGTKELEQVALHANLGYIRNENKADEREDIWQMSFAAEVEVLSGLKLLGDIGVERNSDPESENHPAFVLGGISYDISEKITVDAGVKYGLTKTETDWTYLTGLTIIF